MNAHLHFDQAQRAYDNRLPPDYDAEDLERERWEASLDLIDLLGADTAEQLLWERADEPYIARKIDAAWRQHLEDMQEQADIERAEALAEARDYWN